MDSLPRNIITHIQFIEVHRLSKLIYGPSLVSGIQGNDLCNGKCHQDTKTENKWGVEGR